MIRHDLGLTGYFQVQVDVKESGFLAWMKLFGPASESGRGIRTALPLPTPINERLAVARSGGNCYG